MTPHELYQERGWDPDLPVLLPAITCPTRRLFEWSLTIKVWLFQLNVKSDQKELSVPEEVDIPDTIEDPWAYVLDMLCEDFECIYAGNDALPKVPVVKFYDCNADLRALEAWCHTAGEILWRKELYLRVKVIPSRNAKRIGCWILDHGPTRPAKLAFELNVAESPLTEVNARKQFQRYLKPMGFHGTDDGYRAPELFPPFVNDWIEGPTRDVA